MNINILVQNASSIEDRTSDSTSHRTSASSDGTTTTTTGCYHCRQTAGQLHATTTDNNHTTTTWTTHDGALSPMAVHFIAVGALFVAVLVLAIINAYLHFRSQRRRRRFLAPPPPVERMYSQRRRTRRGRGSVATGADDFDEQSERRPRMTMRMKPTKMFTGSVSC